MLATARAKHRQWRHRARRGQAAIQADWDRLVRQAKTIRWFEVTMIPGLLQTPAYARCLVEENIREYGFSDAEADAAVTARVRRQNAIYEPGREFRFVISEAALHTRIAPPDVLAAQLDRLLTFAELPGVTLSVIPFTAEITITPLHGFVIIDDTVIYETYASEVAVEGAEAGEFAPAFDKLAAEAVTGDEAAEVIRRAITGLRGLPGALNIPGNSGHNNRNGTVTVSLGDR